MPAYRIAILCSFNLGLLPPRLVARLQAVGIAVECYLAPFGQHHLAALDAGSPLYAFRPDAVIVFVDAEDVLAETWWSPFSVGGPGAAGAAGAVLADLRSGLEALQRRLPQASVLVHDFCLTSGPVLGVLDRNSDHSVGAVLDELNRGLTELRRDIPFTLVDYRRWVERHGWQGVVDRRLWYHGRMRLGPTGLDALAELYAAYVVGLTGRTKKCLVCDLDNTLWGGIVGEVGVGGLDLGEDGVGRAYKDFQREILTLRQRGVLLALASKNEYEDVAGAFATHPDMVLGLEHFNAVRIDWNDKADNLLRIAADLNIGLDSLVFVDDSPVECELVRQALPEVTVVQLPDDPVQYPGLLRSLPWFQRTSLSDEDRMRADMMRQDQRRQEVQARFVSQEEFLRSLGMVAELTRVQEGTVTRAAQLTQRTNQFTLTGRRYTEREMAGLGDDPRWLPVLIRVRDRFGDDGFVGLAIARDGGDDWELDTFVLSCRVLGRGVEAALLAEVARLARERGGRRLWGQHVRTKRNGVAEKFLPDHGFVASQDPERWSLDLESAGPPPEWIAVTWASA